MKRSSLFLLIGLFQLTVNSIAQTKIEIHPDYSLYVKIIPDSGYMKVNCEILNPGDSVFYLTKGMQITEIKTDQQPVDLKSTIINLPNNSTRISLHGKPQKIEIAYCGKINPADYPKTTSAVNMVNSKLIELSDQIKWYPSPASDGIFNYSLTLDLPSDYRSVTNSILKTTRNDRQREITEWETGKPVWNITLVAAPGMTRSQVKSNGCEIEIYSTKLPSSYIDSIKNDISKAYHDLSQLYGSAGSGNLIRLVYSPRSAGGYSRAPMIIVSEKFALEQRNQTYGYARDLRLDIHEIAHYWSIADVNTSEDWLNEGLAEFSALMISKKLAGNSFYEVLLKEYRGIVSSSDIRTSIVETQGNSGEREINRYYKPALLLNDLWIKYGDDKIRELFSSFYSVSLSNGGATTELLLDRIEKVLGTDARNSFYEAITKKKWPEEPYPENENSDISIDPVYTGTWLGTLTQFGTSSQFVLNIRIVNGKPTLTHDSPDQGVKDIAVSAFHVKGDSITFHIPLASGVYRGNLDRNKMTITGFWNQRGTDYPLILKISGK